MVIRDVIHIPIIALIQLGIHYLWNLKLSHRAFNSKQIWAVAFFGSLFNVWGQDVIQREFAINTLYGVFQLSAGAWLVFVLATNAKYLAIYGWSKRDFWLDCGGDLLCFIISGLLIYAAT